MTSRAAVIASLLVVGLAGVVAQTPTGVLAGQVVDANTGLGVPEAVVRLGPFLQLRGPAGQMEPTLTATTAGMRYLRADSQGRFAFREVAAGNYALAVITAGYLPSAHGQQQPNGPYRELAFGANQRLSGLMLKAWPYGAITGTVVDEAGDPAVGMEVRLLRQVLTGGRRALVAATSVRTDDRGIYRASSLAPGDYVIAVPTTTVTLPTAVAEAYREASRAANSAAVSTMTRDASGLGVSLGSPGVAVGDDYLVMDGARARLPPSTTSSGPAAVYQTVFYPSVTDASQAVSVAVASGEERSAVNLQLRLARAFTVSGVVQSPSSVLGPLTVTLTPASAARLADPAILPTATTTSTSAGRFLFFGVPEGEYTLRVLRVEPPPPQAVTNTSIQAGAQMVGVVRVTPTIPEAPSSPILWASAQTVVRDADVQNVVLTLANGARVRGHFEFDGTSPPPTPAQPQFQFLTMQLVAADARPMNEFTAARATPDLQFATMEYPPGRYFASPGGVGVWTPTAVRIGGRNALVTPVDLGADDITDVVVTLTDRAPEISGAVRTSAGVGVPDATVVLFPADYQRWVDLGMTPRLLRTTLAARDSTYRIASIVPGEYLVAAYGAEMRRDPSDPSVLAALARDASRVVLATGDKKAVPITVVSIR